MLLSRSPAWRTLLWTAGSLALAGALGAQSRNVTLLGTYNPSEFTNDVWGYTNPANGKEYALVLTQSRTIVVDVTNPGAPAVRGQFSASLSGWRSSLWRDARTYGHYAYVVTEGGSGMQVIDLADPDNPQFVRTDTASVTWRNTHNISIDTDTGVCYVVGTRGGMHLFDLNANPTDPPLIGSYTAEYVHDMQAQDGWAYLAEINRGTMRVLDVSNLPTIPSSGASIPVAVCHTSFPSRDNQYAVATSETTNVGMTFVDVRNKLNPISLGTWKTGSTQAIVHNAFFLDRVVHASYYSEGYQVLDASDPANPVRVGWYDTAPTHTSGYEGNWGCYPFLPSGNVLITDMDYGLFVFKPAASSANYGQPTAGNTTPEIHLFGAPWIGNANFAFEIDDATPSSSAWLIVGAGRTSTNVQGLEILVDLTLSSVVGAATDTNGQGRFPFAMPNDMALVGATIDVQGLCLDAGGPLGLAASAGREFTIFQP